MGMVNYPMPVDVPKGRVVVKFMHFTPEGAAELQLVIENEKGDPLIYWPFTLRAGDNYTITDITMQFTMNVTEMNRADVPAYLRGGHT